MAIVTGSINLSSVSYAAGEIIDIRNGATVTIDASPTTRPGTIQCITSGKLRLENSSSSVPLVLELQDTNRDLRFEGNGIIEVRGAPMTIGTSDGNQQTWDFSTLYSGVITDITYADVETASGSDNFMPWFIVNTTPDYYAAGFPLINFGATVTSSFDNAQEVLFYNSLTRTLSSGDGTNGKLIPSGSRIRIPNILITNQDWQPDVSLIHGISSTGTPTGGSFTITAINRRTGTTIGTTAALAHTASAAAIDSALEAVLGAGTITNSGGPLPTAVVLTLAGAYASLPIALVVNSSVTGGTNSVIYSRENAATNMSLLDLNPSGVIDAEWAAFSQKIYTTNASFSSAKLKHVGMGNNELSFINSNGSAEFDHVSYTSHPKVALSGCDISNISGEVSLNKVVIATGIYGATTVQILPGMIRCDDVRTLGWGTRTSTSAIVGMTLATLPNVPIIRPVVVGGEMRFTNLVNNIIAEPKHSDTPGVQTTANPADAFTNFNCIGTTFAYLGNYGTSATRDGVFNTDAACSNILVVGGSYNMNNHGGGLVVQQLGAGFEVKNFVLTGSRTAIQSFDAPTTFACTAMSGRKVFVNGVQAASPSIDSNQDGQYDLVGCDVTRLVIANVSVQNFVGGNFMDTGSAPTTGHVSFFAFGNGDGVELTGAAFTDQIGSVYLPKDGDTATLTMPFSMHGITGFQNASPRFAGECPNGFANIGRVINDGGATGGTFTITAYDSTDTLIGTTSALAFNASTSTVQTAVRLLAGLSAATVGGSLTAGYVITATGTGVYRFVGDGTNLTGGTKPGTMDSYARYSPTLDNEVFPGIEFSYRPSGGTYSAYQTLTGANISSSFAAVSSSGYNAGGAGLDMRLRVTATGDAEFRRLQQCSIRTTIDPSLWTITDSVITFQGPNPTDVIRIRRLSDLAADPPINLYSFTGGGQKDINVGSNFGTEVYFVREDSTGTVLMRSLPQTIELGYGNLGIVDLFYGAEVQLAQASTLETLNALVTQRLDAAITSRLAATAEAGLAKETTAQSAVDAARLAAALSA